jgi:hypothetical protein
MTRAYANLTLGFSEIATAASDLLVNIAHPPGFVEIGQHPFSRVGFGEPAIPNDLQTPSFQIALKPTAHVGLRVDNFGVDDQ